MMTTQILFDELETVTKNNIKILKETVSKLSENQLIWKPKVEVWNILEVTAHLLEFAKYYHSAFSKKIDTTKFREPKEFFVSSPLGKSMWKSMKLGNAKNVKRKIKSHKLYNPLIVKSIVSMSVLDDFIKSQEQLLDIFERAKTINIRKAKIKLATSNVIKFRVGDALLYVVYHNERHLQQINNLINHPKFPKV